MNDLSGFRNRLISREQIIGTFIKTTSHQSVEVVASANLSFIALVAEHSPFTVKDLDVCILAAISYKTPVLVRVPNIDSQYIQNVLDLGADGIIAPHVNSKQKALEAVSISRFGLGEKLGSRGFSNSSRAGNYGRLSISDMINQSDKKTIVICQIEDKKGIENIEEIAEVTGVDCFFIGRADLAVDMGCTSLEDSKVHEAIEKVCICAKKFNIPLGIYLQSSKVITLWVNKGFTMFIIGSDQSLLLESLKNFSAP